MAEPIIICVVGCIVAILTCIIEWNRDSDNKNLYLISLLVIAIGGFLIACFYGIEKEKKDIENGKLLRRIDTLSKMQSDTLRINLDKSLSILNFERESLDSTLSVLRNQEELKTAYKKISQLQEEKLTEVLGGKTPPTLNIIAQTIADIMYNKEKRDFDEPDFFAYVQFTLSNESKYFLKSVVLRSTGENYKNIRKVIPTSETSWNLIRYNSNESLSEFTENNLGTLAPNKIKGGFSTKVPVGLSEYMFTISVEWNNGYYRANVFLKPSTPKDPIKNYVLKLDRIEFFDAANKSQKVKYTFFSNNVLH